MNEETSEQDSVLRKRQDLNSQVIQAITAGLPGKMNLIRTRGYEHLVQLPFQDSMGDPIQISIHVQDDNTVQMDDAGAIAGLLFSLGQDGEHTPAFKLVTNLAQAHGLEIDFEEGILAVSTTPDGITETLVGLTKVVITILTAVPHMRIQTDRP